ncbi:hypothetical protein INT48_005766 [Thamnidium elegans]|uniref:Major facilitator superfamily (MFS) profile domain-containing protein n=1 Tax=Thamnidium elegans TaxID=101142 RepID=A0A8H7VUX1_9FUNG|nr:hypothetical protein INT48_005766 [Thamnidium elegans]
MSLISRIIRFGSGSKLQGSDYERCFPSRESPDKNKATLWSIFATSVACLGGFLFGYDLGVVGGMLIAPSFQTYFGIDPSDKLREAEINGTIVSVLQIGCLFGALLSTSTADRFGRRYSILLASLVFLIGGILQIIGIRLEVMYIGRIISGLGVGALSMLVPIYVAEIAHQSQRGLLGGLWMFFISTGLAVSYWSHYVVRKIIDEQDNLLWRIPLIIQIVPAILLFFGMLFLFETPRWLCAHGKISEAYSALSKICDASQNLCDEMKLIQDSVDLERRLSSMTSWKHVFSSHNRRRLLLGCGLQTLQQLTGINVINYFSPMVFRSIGLSSGEAELFAIGVYGILKMVVVLVGILWCIDRFGRRPLLVAGGVGMGICMYAFSVCVSSTPAPTPGIDSGLTVTAGLGIVSMYTFFALSWGPCPWIYCSEIYPMSTRAKSTSITTATNWAFNALIGKVSPLLLATSTMGTYVFFGSWCILASIFCYFFVPETKVKKKKKKKSSLR